ncbi:MAG: HypC/HybG/HupF family hydrogenase formation chaperone [Lachnospiraceae bacterium]|nr:HypC/HybG/HupF family hydrogenase formation chaperone [Lachnospiraceae bacterium]
MCLAVPLKLVELNSDKTTAIAERDGIRRSVNVSFIREPKIGEYVIVHAGFAIERIAQKQAEDVMSSYQELMSELAELQADNKTAPESNIVGVSTPPDTSISGVSTPQDTYIAGVSTTPDPYIAGVSI